MDAYDFYGNNGYQRTFNGHGMKCLARGINIPDADLGIGSAEVTAPVPLYAVFTGAQRLPEIRTIETVDQTFVKTQGKGVTLDDFPFTPYFGEPLGGM